MKPHFLIVVPFLSIVLFLSGCASTEPMLTYEMNEQIAHIKPGVIYSPWHSTGSTGILSVDGNKKANRELQKRKLYATSGDSLNKFAILPGMRDIEVRCYAGGTMRTSYFGHGHVKINIESGHKYRFACDVVGKREIRIYLIDETTNKKTYAYKYYSHDFFGNKKT